MLVSLSRTAFGTRPMLVHRRLNNGSFLKSVEESPLDGELSRSGGHLAKGRGTPAHDLNQTLFDGPGSDERRRVQARLRKAEIVV